MPDAGFRPADAAQAGVLNRPVDRRGYPSRTTRATPPPLVGEVGRGNPHPGDQASATRALVVLDDAPSCSKAP